jgi:hypothetical protein
VNKTENTFITARLGSEWFKLKTKGITILFPDIERAGPGTAPDFQVNNIIPGIIHVIYDVIYRVSIHAKNNVTFF